MIAGVDVSNYQPVIDWRAVARAGVAFAYVLITDGNRFANGKRLEQCAGARGVGLDVGGYHFARPNLNDAAEEARHYRAHAPDGLTLPPALDLEAAWLGTRSANTDWALRWFDTIDPPVRLIYTNGDGARNHLDSGRLAGAGVELWYAHPTGAPGNFAGVGAWTTPSVVQWGVAPVAGIAGGVDRNSMTESTLARYRGAPPPGDDDMPPTIGQLADTNELVIFPGNGGRPWTAAADDLGLVKVLVFGALGPNPVPVPNPVPKITDAAQIAAIRHWIAAGAAGDVGALVGTAQIALHPA